MGDGGFRPAYNVKFATTSEDQVIVGMDVANAGSDMAQLAPTVAGKTEVYAPVPEPKVKRDEQGNEVEQGKHQPKPNDSEAVAQWRARMAIDKAEETTSSVRARPNVSAHRRATEDC